MSKTIENKKSSLGVAELQQNREDVISTHMENSQAPKNESNRISSMDVN